MKKQGGIYSLLDHRRMVIWIQEIGDYYPDPNDNGFDIRMLDLYNKGVAKEKRKNIWLQEVLPLEIVNQF